MRLRRYATINKMTCKCFNKRKEIFIFKWKNCENVKTPWRAEEQEGEEEGTYIRDAVRRWRWQVESTFLCFCRLYFKEIEVIPWNIPIPIPLSSETTALYQFPRSNSNQPFEFHFHIFSLRPTPSPTDNSQITIKLERNKGMQCHWRELT